MNIILDSNILFSALIRDSTKRRLILEYDGFFLFPEYIFEELEEHKEELLEKAEMSKEDFEQLLQLLLQKVLIVPTEALLPYKQEAFTLAKEIDPDDTLFIACALAYPESVIWSEDKKLKELGDVIVLDTKEIRGIL